MYSIEVFQPLQVLLGCRLLKALFAHKMLPLVKSFPSSVRTTLKHFLFPASMLLSPLSYLGQANTCPHSLGQQD